MYNLDHHSYHGNPTLFSALFGWAAFIFRKMTRRQIREEESSGKEPDGSAELKPIEWKQDPPGGKP